MAASHFSVPAFLQLLFVLALFPFSWALKFDLQAYPGHSSKHERCIRNFVAKDTLVVVTATVSGQKGDGQTVNMHIKDAVGNEHGRPKDVAGEKRMAFTSAADTAFDVCFENILTASHAVMNPSRHVELDIDIGADARDWSAIQAAEKLKPVETELRRIEELVQEIVNEMDYLRTREQKLRDTNESTNERVKWFAFGTMGMLVGLGAWQIVYLRAYFRTFTSLNVNQGRCCIFKRRLHRSVPMEKMAPLYSYLPVATATKAAGSGSPTPRTSTGGKAVEEADPAQTPIHELLTEDMVNVYVGSKRKKFHLHKDLVCDRSSFFKKALAGGFKEQEERAVYLPEDDVGAFVLFVQWIYGVPPRDSTTPAMITSLFALYVLAEKFCIELLKNLSMDMIRTIWSDTACTLSATTIGYVYDNTPETSPMRRFIVNHSLYSLLVRKVGMAKEFLELMKKGGDFAVDFASATLQYSPSAAHPSDPSRERNCSYHEHNSSKICALHGGYSERPPRW